MKKSKNYIIILCMLFTVNFAKADKPILFMGATAHLGNGETIKNSLISINNGKFEIVADATLIRIDPSAFDTIIKLDGKHIYPSFILPNTTLGLVEIDAVRATRDERETGDLNPNVRSQIAYNTESIVSSTVRTNGILIAQITPRGGLISGTSSLMQLDGWNWEDAVVRMDDGVHLNWPGVYHKHREKGKVNIQQVKTYDQERLSLIHI